MSQENNTSRRYRVFVRRGINISDDAIQFRKFRVSRQRRLHDSVGVLHSFLRRVFEFFQTFRPKFRHWYVFTFVFLFLFELPLRRILIRNVSIWRDVHFVWILFYKITEFSTFYVLYFERLHTVGIVVAFWMHFERLKSFYRKLFDKFVHSSFFLPYFSSKHWFCMVQFECVFILSTRHF